MRKATVLKLMVLAVMLQLGVAANSIAQSTGELRGDPAAIDDALAMVETMGGAAVWKDLKSVHFVHEWDVVNRPDRYLENEILDLTGPRSHVTMDSEIYARTRVYSPEHGYWSITNGEYRDGNEDSLAAAMERAPFSLYRLARAVALGDDELEIRYGKIEQLPDIPLPALEFAGPDGVARGWVLLNARKEPMIWATTQYVYVMGPLKRFGNLLVPNWATTSNGLVRYEMVALTGSNQQPDLAMFAPPAEHSGAR